MWPVPSLQVYVGDVHTAGPCLPAGGLIFCSCLASPHWEAGLARTRGSEKQIPSVQTLTTVHNVFQAERKAYILNGVYSINCLRGCSRGRSSGYRRTVCPPPAGGPSWSSLGSVTINLFPPTNINERVIPRDWAVCASVQQISNPGISLHPDLGHSSV